MANLKRKIIFLVVGIALTGIVLFFIFFFQNKDKNYRTPFSVLPEDAVFIIKCNHPEKGWDKIRKTSFWTYLQENGIHKSVDENIQLFDSIACKYPALLKLLNNRELLISAHVNKNKDSEYLYIVDFEKSSLANTVRYVFLKTIQISGVKIEKYDQGTLSLWKLKYAPQKSPFYIANKDNLVLASYSFEILNKALKTSNRSIGLKKENIITEMDANDGLFTFYFNFKQLANYYNSYFTEPLAMVELVNETLNLASYNTSIENEQIELKGPTLITDSLTSFFHVLADVKPGKIRGLDIISKNTAIYLSCSFSSFDVLLEKLKINYMQKDSILYHNLEKRLLQARNLLGVDFEKELSGWIGNEIAVIKLQPHSNINADDLVVGVHASNIRRAKESLLAIEKNVFEKVARVKNISYHNYDIRYLNVKGFFRLFFGKHFKKIGKPYYTIVGDFVFFSNSHYCLTQVIDDYLTGNTLKNDQSFSKFAGQFKENSSFMLLSQMTKLYALLYYYSDEEQKKEIKNNKEQILGFSQIGMQLIANGDRFSTRIICKHDPLVGYHYELEKIEHSAEKTNNLDYESLGFRITIDSSYSGLSEEPVIKKYFENGMVKEEGQVVNKKPHGIWKTYFCNGRLASIVNYNMGKVNGNALFYHDTKNNRVKAEVQFKNGNIVDTYREYYSSGTRKAEISYQNGTAHGNATYFYVNGNLKIKGKFSKGKRKGTWKYFTVHGELYDREKWKKNKKRN